MRWLATFVLLLGLASGPAQAGSERHTELVMFELGTCIYCAVWNDAVGHGYDDTLAGKRAPLRRVFLTDPRPDDLTHIEGIRMTPTFVLLDDGREVGRIHGYATPELFWNLLSSLLQKMTEERG